MADSNGGIHPALELVDCLDQTLPVGTELREQALRFFNNGQLANAIQCCHLLYKLGLDQSNAYVQGVAYHLMGSIYLKLGNGTTDLDRAVGHFKQSVQLFSTYSGRHRQHNEGVVWLSLGLLYEEQCRRNRERYTEAIQAYKTAHNLLKEVLDPLEPRAEDALTRATHGMTEWLIAQKHAESSAPVSSSPAEEPGFKEAVQGESQDSEVNSVEAAIQNAANAESKPPIFLLLLILALLIILAAPFVTVLLADLVSVRFESIVIPFLISYFIAVFLILARGGVGVLIGSWRYYLPTNQAAIIEYRGRIWERNDSGRHRLVPFVEEVKSFVSLEKRAIWVFVRGFSTPDGFIPTVLTRAEYYVNDGVMAWRGIASNIQRTQFLGFSHPVEVEQTTKLIEQQARQLVKQILKEKVNDPARSDLFKDKKSIESFILCPLNELSGQYGIAFSRLDIEVHLRDI